MDNIEEVVTPVDVETTEAVEQPVEQTPELTNAEVIAEATNDHSLSKDEFMLGGRKFTVVSLGYRQYLQFVSKLEPILKLVAGKVRSSIAEAAGAGPKTQVAIPGLVLQALGNIDPSYLMNFCADDLPAMTQIVCNMKCVKEKAGDDPVTTQWIEDAAESPFQLIDIVLMQVNKNKMIVQFASFFAQVLPMFLGRTETASAK